MNAPGPDNRGYYGDFGGRFVPETLMPALLELQQSYRRAWADAQFRGQWRHYLKDFAGRPTPLYFAENISRKTGLRIYLKREDLLHTGAHKINNTLGQGLLAKRMGKRRVIAETGAGQHGVATATVAALLKLDCEVFMGAADMQRQELNVFRMRLLGAKVSAVNSGSETLKDATNQAMRDWVATVRDTHYIIGSAVGPHPFPLIVRNFQAVIGQETRRQLQRLTGGLPDFLVACVGGGSNAIGLFHPFYQQRQVVCVGVEAAGRGLRSGAHAAPLAAGRVGVLHGSKSYLLQNADGQIAIAHSLSAGLDYPGVGPEHSWYKDSGRARYVSVTDEQALAAVYELSRREGIIPALESAHALAYVLSRPRPFKKNAVVVVCLSGRGDKDMDMISRLPARTV